ncbi:hypothetical protein L2E82_34564 [Cichorium intybus]|uniref:Uncharacterized protein n=1 Tax=Cichorium intybus TaxID=13427 RepID=A0ACB9BMC0_CICIN|nr:hypothetical protein L2E82_34564 [Cichorium intybus]
MQPLQVLYIFILILLTISLVEAQYYAKARCNDTCGHVRIPFPFGIGSNCAANEWYNVDCIFSKPYLSALNNVQVLDISSRTVTVNVSVISVDCENPIQDSNLVLTTSHGKSPFVFAGSINSLFFLGCGTATIMENGTVITGCSTTCGKDTVPDITNCAGVGCCRTAIPHDLQSFTFNLTGSERHDEEGTCGSAFLVDTSRAIRYYMGDVLIRFIGKDRDFVPITLSWNETFNVNSTRCNETCGEVPILYPFGIERNCSWTDWFNVDCNSSKPYLSAFSNLEVLGVSPENETVTINVPMISSCENNNLDLSRSPFRISESDNMFVAEGCGSAIIMENGTIVTGCSTTCNNDTVSDRSNCFGIGCCQTTIPRDIESFTMDLTGMGSPAGNGTCASAFLVDVKSFTEGRFSGQSAPITLVWPHIYYYDSTECRWCEHHGGFCYPLYNDDDVYLGVSCHHYGGSKKGVILGKLFSHLSIRAYIPLCS